MDNQNSSTAVLENLSQLGEVVVSSVLDPIMMEESYVGASARRSYLNVLRNRLVHSDLWKPGFTLTEVTTSNFENYKLWEKTGDGYLEAVIADLVQISNSHNIDHDSFHNIQTFYKSNETIGEWARDLNILSIVEEVYYLQVGENLPQNYWERAGGKTKGNIFEAFLGVMYRIGENIGMAMGYFLVKSFVRGIIISRGYDLTKVPEKDAITWVKEVLDPIHGGSEYPHNVVSKHNGKLYRVFITNQIAKALGDSRLAKNPFAEGFDKRSTNMAKKRAFENMKEELKNRGFDLDNRPLTYNDQKRFNSILQKAQNLGYDKVSFRRLDNTKKQIELGLFGITYGYDDVLLAKSNHQPNYNKARNEVMDIFEEENT